MITPLLRLAFDPVFQRRRGICRLHLLAVSILAASGVAAALLFSGYAPWWAALAAFAAFFLVRRIAGPRLDPAEPDYSELARSIESAHPQLHALLLTAVEQRPDKSGKLHLLQQKVVSEAVTASRRLNWVASVPSSRIWLARGILACAITSLALVLFSGANRYAWGSFSAAAKGERGVTVTPGDTSLERGAGLIVLADFHLKVPGEATLIVQPKNQPAQRIPLVKNLDDPVFGGGLPEVDADLTYRIEYAGTATRDFSVKVFEHPRLDRADATLHFPAYTKLPEKNVPDTHRVSAVQGTKLDVKFQLNKPVNAASLVAKDGSTIPLKVAPDSAAATLSGFAVDASQTYELKLVDADGRPNKIRAQFIVEALQHRAPELKFQTPKGDQRVSPIEEVAFRGTAWDDFGVSRYGITFDVAGRGDKEIELGGETKADEKREFAHLLKLEELGVKADDLVSWFLWAEDAGPDGKTRRTEGDMYFAEVRPFEEVFRRDNGGGDSGGEGEGKAGIIATSQKEVLSATWNLKRAEAANAGPERPSEKYLKDLPVVRDAQEEALNHAKELAEKLTDPKLQALAGNMTRAMQSALDHLTAAAADPAPLPEALKDEQAAYDATLKLAEHEFRVQKNKSKGKGKGGEKQKQQLDELEMKDEKEKYETKKEAEPEQQKQQREQLAILNRLKELAQRQQDVNQRLKELQNALQAAKTEKEQEEIRRQLRRLREEEQQLLTDIDETRQKMEQSSQQSQLADERSQLDKVRGEAQKAAESMEKGETSQALASGTRTQRDLEQMRDDFRKKTSGQFNEDLRQMRTDARELAQNQEDIGEKLKPAAEPAPGSLKRRSLEASDDREKLEEKLAKQQKDLGKLTEKLQTVSEQAENVEPLLAKELYDALRKTTQAGTGQTLEKTQQLAQIGNAPDAQKFEEKARQEIEELKGGVERAAESVLGDEAEALRQARAELDKVKGELERELAQARPDLAEALVQSGNRKSPVENVSLKAEPPTEGADAKESGDGGGDMFVEAYSNAQSGEKAEQAGNFELALSKLKEAARQLDSLTKKYPNWSPQIVEYRKKRTAEAIARVRKKLGQDADDSSQLARDGDEQKPGEVKPGKKNDAASTQGEQGEKPGSADTAKANDGSGKAPGENPGEGEAKTAQGQGKKQGQVKGEGQGQGQGEGKDGSPSQQIAQASQGQGQGKGQAQSKGEGEAGGDGAERSVGSDERPRSSDPERNDGSKTAQQGKGSGQGKGQGNGEGQGSAGSGGGDQQNAGNPSNTPNAGAQRGGARLRQLAGQDLGGDRNAGTDAGGGGAAGGGGFDGGYGGGGPLTGERFAEWSDRLRNVEEMVDDPALRTEVARIREIAKGIRVEFKQHDVKPKWDLVKTKISEPLAELRNRLTEELARRESKENLVPIDRDPVPAQYAERVRRYYEELGRSSR